MTSGFLVISTNYINFGGLDNAGSSRFSETRDHMPDRPEQVTSVTAERRVVSCSSALEFSRQVELRKVGHPGSRWVFVLFKPRTITQDYLGNLNTQREFYLNPKVGKQ